MTINNDYLKGYISALDNIKAFCDTTITVSPLEQTLGYIQVNNFIKQVKENYKQLVKDLNESQSKKTT